MATQDFQLMQPRQLRDSARTVPVSVADVTPPLVHIQRLAASVATVAGGSRGKRNCRLFRECKISH